MKNKKIFIIATIALTIVSLFPVNVFASSANVYLSPSSGSVVRGSNITVQVRVNSGADAMNSAQATLNFDSSKLQYVSYASGSFTTPIQSSPSTSSFTYAAALLGSTVSSDKLIFSVTFKSLVSGSASLSLSGVDIANAGVPFDSITASGGTIAISEPVVNTPTVNTPSNTTNTNTNVPTTTQEAKDTDAPKLKADPVIEFGQNSITLKFDTDEKAKIKINYTLGQAVKSVLSSELQTSHEFVIGKDEKLIAGTTYKVDIITTDSLDNTVTAYSKNIRTRGVDYTVQIMDTDGKPLANHAVQLHSDPISATTDYNGFATFNDVTPGEHTLIFDIDGLVMRQAVLVGSVDTVINTPDDVAVRLPIQFAAVDEPKADNQFWYLFLAIAAGVLGAAIMFLVQSGLLVKAFVFLRSKTVTAFKSLFNRAK